MKQAQLSNKAINPVSPGPGSYAAKTQEKPVDVSSLGMKNDEMARRATTARKSFDSQLKYLQSKIPGSPGSATTVPGYRGKVAAMNKYSGLSLITEKAADDRLKDTFGRIGGAIGGVSGASVGSSAGILGSGANTLRRLTGPLSANVGSPAFTNMVGKASGRMRIAALLGALIGGVGGAVGGRGFGRSIVPKKDPTFLDKIKDLPEQIADRLHK